ncbi:MAG: hypothetical protein IPH78_12255 [Bacteroidetes bacterium]|nr:hypothetical protein [Bacteroidota bacterium]
MQKQLYTLLMPALIATAGAQTNVKYKPLRAAIFLSGNSLSSQPLPTKLLAPNNTWCY